MHLLEVQAMKKPTKVKVIAAIQNSGGSLAVAAAALDMSRQQLAEQIVRTPVLLEFVEKGDDMAIADDLVSATREGVKLKAPWAIQHWLSTFATNRGYFRVPMS
jgi:hypothetical protein